jgi:PAS domain-containing protein
MFRRIVEAMPKAVVYSDREGIIRLWNRGAETIFGYRREDALGRTLDLIIPERWRPAIRQRPSYQSGREGLRIGRYHGPIRLVARPAARALRGAAIHAATADAAIASAATVNAI